MAFQIPENLNPDCAPIAWLLGAWRGNGHGDYPTIEKFEFEQELVFQQDGRPFFHYSARSWVIDPDTKERLRPGAMETGFIRSRLVEPGKAKVEMVLAHQSGVADVWYGEASDGKIEFATRGVGLTETAKEVTAGHRLYGNVNGQLLYAYDMKAMGQELQPHLWAQLNRVGS
ncbi:MAG TPA: FABP family protein [Nocardioides sp.]|uniref:FABP family protein n=1 Tax=Nocardioides sp. TaxID=35761 RepID=UPI002ED86670